MHQTHEVTIVEVIVLNSEVCEGKQFPSLKSRNSQIPTERAVNLYVILSITRKHQFKNEKSNILKMCFPPHISFFLTLWETNTQVSRSPWDIPQHACYGNLCLNTVKAEQKIISQIWGQKAKLDMKKFMEYDFNCGLINWLITIKRLVSYFARW